MFSKGRIVDFEYGSIVGVGITQGIKGNQQYKYNMNPRYSGSNGTYATSFESYGSYLNVVISVYEDSNHRHTFDIRDQVLIHNQMKRVSPQLIDYIKKNNVGNKVDLVKIGNIWALSDINQLDINYK